jgi:tRNA pseudouridine38-40 synthase
MTKFMAVVEYDGTAYHGWQLQKELPTIQGSLEAAIEKIVRIPVRVHGAGRTDAGVHAIGQTAHFTAPWEKSSEELQRACNALLPRDIVLRRLERAPDDFHARHSAHSKTYEYSILNSTLRSPLARAFSWHIQQPLDVESMNEGALRLVGSHDFAAFGTPTDGTPSTVRRMFEASVTKQDDMISFAITGSGFLRYMVRAIVGTLVPVGLKKTTPDEFGEILNSLDRSRSGATAPPHGLVLMSVSYENAAGRELSTACRKIGRVFR